MANTASNSATTATTSETNSDTAAQKITATSGDTQPAQNILQGAEDVCVVEDKSDNPVLLERPEPETTKEVALQPGQDYIFAFDKAEATSFVQDGSDLKITFDCGAVLILKNYTASVGSADPATFAFSDAIPTGALDGLVKIAQAEEAAKVEEPQTEVRKEHADQQADGSKVANIEPAAGDTDASKLAQIEPAAGDAGGAAGRGGYGFNSSYSTTPVGPLNAVGPIDPTQLRYDARFPEPDVFIEEERDSAPEIGSVEKSIDETNLSGGPIVISDNLPVEFGEDGPGTLTPNGSFSSGGSQLGGDLFSNGVPVVVTATANGYVGMAGGVTVFTLTIDPSSGNYTFTQFEQLDHADGNDDNDVVDLVFGIAATDNDGDVANTTITIHIADDAPVISGDGVKSVDEDDLSPASVSGNLVEDFNEDGQGDIHTTGTWSATGDLDGGVLSSHGHAVTITATANGYEGVANGVTVFDVTIDPVTGAYTFNLYEPLDHSDGGDTIRLTFGAEIVDYDGDTDQTNIIIDVQDDEPKIVDGDEPKVGHGLENIDETNLGPIVVNGSVNVDFGGDGPGSFGGNGTFNASGSMTGGELRSHGVDVDVNLVGNTYEGRANGTLVFTLQVNNDGSYSFTQFEQLDHADGNADNDVIRLQFGVRVEDFDGDSATGSIIINIADDVPTIDGDGTKVINEADLSPAVVNGNLVEDFGEDGQGNIHTTGTWNASGDLAGGQLRSDGNLVTVTATANGYEGTANGATVFTLTIDPVTGAYTFTLIGALDHSPGGSQILLTFGAEIVDYDGDTDLADIVIKVKDDVPEIDDKNPTIGNGLEVVDETNLGPEIRNGHIDFDFGGDGPGTFGANGTYSSSIALTSEGRPVTITPSGTGYVGTAAGGEVIFTMTINADGTYQFTLLGTLDHPIDGPSAADHNDAITLNFGVAVSDADGDSDTGNIIVRVLDDGPTAHDDFNTLDDVTHTATGNVISGLNGGPGAADILSQDDVNTVTQISFNGNTVNVPTVGSIDINGDYGTLTISADGTYTYHQFSSQQPLSFGETLEFPVLGEGVPVTGAALANVGLMDGVLTVPSDSTGTITFDGGITAYNDTLGAYTVGPDGTIHAVQMLFANGEDTTDGSTYDFAVGGGETAGFFIIANGDVANGGYPGIDFNVGQLNFVYDYGLPTERAATIYDTAAHLSLVYTSPSNVDTVLQGPTYHSTERSDSAAINPDGQVHVISGLVDENDPTHLRIGFEDLPNLGDRDYGDVVFNLTLNINKGVCGTDEFLYTLTDGDGDTSQATLTVVCDDNKPILVQPERVEVDETNLNPTTSVSDTIVADFNGEGPGSFSGTGTFTGGPFTSHGETVAVAYNPATNTYTGTSHGETIFTLVITNTATGTYTFTLLGTLDHPDATNPNDGLLMNFGIRATDVDGDSVTGTITVNVLDDGPVAVNDGNFVNTLDPVVGNVLTNDDAGSDGLGAVTAVTFNGNTVNVPNGGAINVVGTYGTLHINSDGSYTYTPVSGADGTDNFTYTMRDFDGDTSSAQLSIGVDVDVQPIIVNDKVSVDETNLNPTTSVSDHIDVNFGTDGPGTVTGNGTFTGTFTSEGSPVAVAYNAGTNTYTGTSHGDTIFTLTIQPNGNYTYTLLGTLDHPNVNDPNDSMDMQFGVRATDADGDTANGTITVRVFDDGPKANNDCNEFDVTTQGKDLNVVLILDVSGSMAGNKLALLKSSVANLLGDFNGYTGGEIKVHIVPFSTSAQTAQTFNITSDADFNAAVNFLNGMTADGFTNYESPMQSAINWLNGATANDPITGADTYTYFVSDGEPNRFVNGGGGTSEGTAGQVMGEITGTDGTNEVHTLQGLSTEVIGVGIGVSATTIARLNIIDSDGHALDVQDPNDLDAALQGTNPLIGIATGNVITGVNGGTGAADVLSEDDVNTVTAISFNGHTVAVNPVGGTDINGANGTLHINADGSYEYNLFNPPVNQPTNGTIGDVFTYTLTDGDGDPSNATLTLKGKVMDVGVDIKVNNNVDDVWVKEDQSVFVPVTANVADGTGNETLSLTLKGVGAGWTLTGTGWAATGVAGEYKITLPVGQASYNGGFTVKPPANSDLDLTNLSVTAHVADPDTAGANSTDGFNVRVDAVVDAPVLTVPGSMGPFGIFYKDTGYSLPVNIASNVTDTDGSEVVTKIIIDLSKPFTHPAGQYTNLDSMGIFLNKGTEVSPGIWEIQVNAGNTAAALDGLTINVPNNMDYTPIHQDKVGWHDVSIKVTSVVTEANLGGLENDYTDNTTMVTKDIPLTFYVTPLVVDLNGDGIHLLNQDAGVVFDMTNDGVADHTSWVNHNDGLLAIDTNNDGVINNQSELFGDNATSNTGFENLGHYDVNGDHVINAADDVFAKLLVWQDSNSDGISQSDELFGLADAGITSINLNATETFEQVGDSVISHTSTFTYADGHTGAIADAWFNVLPGEVVDGLGQNDVQDAINDFVFQTEGPAAPVVDSGSTTAISLLQGAAIVDLDAQKTETTV